MGRGPGEELEDHVIYGPFLRYFGGILEAINACLGGNLRPLDACPFPLLPMLAGTDVESSMVPLQADLFLSGKPLLLEHGDH